MAKDFKQNPFMKSIQSEYFYREQEIKIEKEHKQKPKNIWRTLKDEKNF